MWTHLHQQSYILRKFDSPMCCPLGNTIKLNDRIVGQWRNIFINGLIKCKQ